MKLASVARPFQTAMLAVGTVLAAATTWGDIFYVSPTGTNTAAFTRTDPGDLRTAINTKASSTRTSWDNGDVVCLLPGTYDFSEWSSAGEPADLQQAIPDRPLRRRQARNMRHPRPRRRRPHQRRRPHDQHPSPAKGILPHEKHADHRPYRNAFLLPGQWCRRLRIHQNAL